MKALVISACAPDATTEFQTGTTNWVLRLTQLLAREHDVTLLTTPPVRDPWFKENHVQVIVNEPKPVQSQLSRVALSVSRGVYPSMWLLYSPEVTAFLRNLQKRQFDVCWILEDYGGMYLRDLPSFLPVAFHRSYVFSMQGSFGRGLTGLYRKHTATVFDRFTTSRADLVLTGTQESCEFLRNRYPNNGVEYCPVKPCYLPEATLSGKLSSPSGPDGRLMTVFLADMGFVRNAEGARWFLTEVLPAMEESLRRKYHFRFIGRKPEPCPSIQGLPVGSSVEFTGFVEDLTASLQEAQVAFIPIFGGNGVRIKTLTLLGTGLPTVSTLDALEGLGVEDGKEVLVAKDAKGFAQAFERLLEPSFRVALHRHALAYMGNFLGEEEDSGILLQHSRLLTGLS